MGRVQTRLAAFCILLFVCISTATLAEAPKQTRGWIIELKDQPLHSVATTTHAAYAPELETLSNQAADVYQQAIQEAKTKAPQKDRHRFATPELGPEKKQHLNSIGNQIDEIRDTYKSEVYAQLETRLKPQQAAITKAIEACGGFTTGSTYLTNMVFAHLSDECVESLHQHPLVKRITPDRIVYVQLDTSVNSTGAPSWYANNYTGYGWDVAVVDTGMDDHPALNITFNQTFHATGVLETNYNDDNTTTLDLHGHGTHCGGIIASQNDTYRGVAYTISNLINAKAGWLTTTGTGAMTWSDGMSAFDWAIRTAGADVISYSFGASYNQDDCNFCRFVDAVVDDLGVMVVVSAGNDGPSASTVGAPAIAYNVFSVANVNNAGTITRADDSIASSSSAGPTAGGRVKPDIAAPGSSIMSTVPASGTVSDPSGWKSISGTSMAAPHVAGAIALLLDYKNTLYDPRAIKALFLNTANEQGTFSTRNRYGWGYLNLSNAYLYKDAVFLAEINESGQGSALLYRGNRSANTTATLVWNRHVAYNNDSYPTDASTLNNLDLYVYDELTGLLNESSNSTVDNVEKVNVTGTGTAILLVKSNTADFAPTSTDNDTFALATPENFTLMQGPLFELNSSLPSTLNDAGFAFNTTINNTGDLRAFTVIARFNSSSLFNTTNQSQNISVLAENESGILHWNTLRVEIGVYNITLLVNATSYGVTFTANTTIELNVSDDDAVAPSFSEWNYRDTLYNESIPVNLSITDPSGVNSTVRLYYDYGSNGTDGNLTLTNTTATAWNGTIPAPGTAYAGGNITFFVEAFDLDNDRPADRSGTNSSNHTINVTDTVPPAVTLHSPSNATITNQTSIDFNFSFTDNAFNESVNCSVILNQSWVVNRTNLNNNTAYNITLSLGANRYNWSVNCTDPENNTNSSETRTLIIDQTKPRLPDNLSATNQDDASVLLNWSEVTLDVDGNNESGNVTYLLFRHTNSSLLNETYTGNRSNHWFNTTNTSFLDLNITQDTTYWYRITVQDAAGNRNHSNTTNTTINSTTKSACTNSYSAWSSCSGGTKSRTRTCYGGGFTNNIQTQTSTDGCTTTGSSPCLMKGSPLLLKGSIPDEEPEPEANNEPVPRETIFDSPLYKASYTAARQARLKEVSIPLLPPSGDQVFGAYNLSRNGSDNLTNLTVYLKIPKAWFAENQLKTNSLELHYLDQEWETISHHQEDEDDNYYYVSALLPGSGVVSITAKTQVLVEPTITPHQTNQTANTTRNGSATTRGPPPQQSSRWWIGVLSTILIVLAVMGIGWFKKLKKQKRVKNAKKKQH